MRMLMKVQIPTQAGNEAIQNGSLPAILRPVIGAMKAEAACFIAEDGMRTGLLFFDTEDSTDVSPAAEPLLIRLEAGIAIVPAVDAQAPPVGSGGPRAATSRMTRASSDRRPDQPMTRPFPSPDEARAGGTGLTGGAGTGGPGAVSAEGRPHMEGRASWNRSSSSMACGPASPSSRSRSPRSSSDTAVSTATAGAQVAPEGAGHSVPADRSYSSFGPPTRRLAVLVDRVPPGEVEIRRHEHVRAVDGAVGHVEGLALDDAGHVTHILLEKARPSGPTEVAIPVASLARIERDGIHLRLSKREIDELPELGITPPGPGTPA